MAIGKSKTMENGASGNYWRIISIYIDRQNLRIHGTIGLFKDQATSAAGKPPLGEVKTFSFPLNLTEFFAAINVTAYVYTKIIERAETLITHDPITGDELAEPYYLDEDLANGDMV